MPDKSKFSDLIKTKIRDDISDCLITSSRVWLEVGDVMSKDAITVSPNETVVSTAKIM